MLSVCCAGRKRPIEQPIFDQKEVPKWFEKPPLSEEKAYAVRTATATSAQMAILRATTLVQCGLLLHDDDQGEMWVEQQTVFQEGPLQFRAYVLGARDKRFTK
tara:strand:+ start:1227 stop:1535 length:309 start_codon:yes stop_codon:yes gene_type:complete